MLKDDKMMSLLTFIVIMVAVGTMVQRMDVFQRYFNGETEKLALVRDEAIVRANSLSVIDVLANDTGLKAGDPERLIIIDQPACGRVFARNGVAEYLPAERCVGQQAFTYSLSGEGGGLRGDVVVTVRLAELSQAVVAADAQLDIPAPPPQAPRPGEQVTAPSAQAPTAPEAQVTASVGDTVQAPSVPRPEAPAIGNLPDSASAAASSGTSAGITREGAGSAPNLVLNADSLSGGGATPGAPATPLPRDPAVPSLNPPMTAEGQATRGGTGVLAQPDQPAPVAGQQGDAATAGTSGGDPTVAMARVEPDRGSGDAGTPSVAQPGGTDASVPQMAPPSLPGATGEPGATASQPADALAALRNGTPGQLAPVNTTPPAGLPDPTGQPAVRPEAAPVRRQPAANCSTPPSLTLDVRPAAITYAIIESPCHAGTIAELAYEGLRFAIAIDLAGTGTIAVPGFEHASDATLYFAGGERLTFNIPFNDTEKMDRVALASRIATPLELHAFEFGATPGSDGHVGPGNPRRHDDVRRSGGGYLLSYAPVDGLGQAITVYTFWHRRKGETGVIKLDLGVGPAPVGAPSCGEGAVTGKPDFVVLRSHAGKLERPEFGVLAPMDCAELAASGNGYIADAVADMIVRPR